MMSIKKSSEKDLVAITKKELRRLDHNTLVTLSSLSLKYAKCLEKKTETLERLWEKRTEYSKVMKEIMQDVRFMQHEVEVLNKEIENEFKRRVDYTDLVDAYNTWTMRMERCSNIMKIRIRGFVHEGNAKARNREKISAEQAWKEFEMLANRYNEKMDFEKAKFLSHNCLFDSDEEMPDLI